MHNFNVCAKGIFISAFSNEYEMKNGYLLSMSFVHVFVCF